MEPRPHERGNSQAQLDAIRNYVLQWSHVLTNVETPVAPHDTGSRRMTSMEPRPHERGNIALVVVRERRAATSMEPRPHERGNTPS